MAAHEPVMLKRTEPAGRPHTDPQPTRTPTAGGLIPGSTTARALYQVWSGNPVTVVNSPPGAGKTALVVDVIRQLLDRTDLTVWVAAPNNGQVRGLANRLTALLKPKSVLVVAKKIQPEDVPDAVILGDRERGRDLAARHVRVCTLARAMMSPPTCDVMIVDEAYQATHLQVRSAMANATQVLLVGDPGQIGPVVTVRTGQFEGPTAPHLRAPDVFRRHDDAVTLSLPYTYRFGSNTVAALTPLYDFPFSSARPPRTIIGQPELDAVRVGGVNSNTDEDLLGAAVRRATTLVGQVVDADGELLTVGQRDVAIVASHNAQVSLLTGMLADRGCPDIVVGTADRLQGGQWEAVVAVDPLAGGVQGGHATSLGRLCVMASRHKSHLTWVHDGAWAAATRDDPSLTAPDRRRAQAVRSSLTGERAKDPHDPTEQRADSPTLSDDDRDDPFLNPADLAWGAEK